MIGPSKFWCTRQIQLMGSMKQSGGQASHVLLGHRISIYRLIRSYQSWSDLSRSYQNLSDHQNISNHIKPYGKICWDLLRSYQCASYKTHEPHIVAGLNAIPGVCPGTHLFDFSSGAWLRALCLQGLLGRMSLGLKNPGFDVFWRGTFDHSEMNEKAWRFRSWSSVDQTYFTNYQNAMRAVGCSWLWAYCWFFWGLSGLHCSHSVRRKSIKVGLRCGPQWNLLQISASSHRSSQGWKCSGDSFRITISHCRKGAECWKFGYWWKQVILRRQPHSHNMESRSISIANFTSLGNGFRPKVNRSEPCFTLREVLTLEEILLIPQNSWAGTIAKQKLSCRLGFSLNN